MTHTEYSVQFRNVDSHYFEVYISRNNKSMSTYFHFSWKKIRSTGVARLYIEKMLMRDSLTYGMVDHLFFCKMLFILFVAFTTLWMSRLWCSIAFRSSALP